VVAYVVRDDALLVFDHRDFPEAGTQVPAGTVEGDEELESAVVREVLEETGVKARVVRSLGTADEIAPRGEPRRNHFFQLDTEDPRDSWEHIVSGAGSDRSLVFSCRFIPLSPPPVLAADGDFLHLVARTRTARHR
jgi:ADP-ribose pyrophosphatase YjhB (NUDIX family)